MSLGISEKVKKDNPAWLMIGSIGTMLVAIISVPLLSQFYGAGDLGVYQEFLVYGMILGPIACLRFETALVSKEGVARHGEVYSASFFLLSVLFLLSLAAFFVLRGEEKPSWLPLVPAFIATYGIMLIGQNSALTNKKYRTFSFYKIVYFSLYMLIPIPAKILFPSLDSSFIIWMMVIGQGLYIFQVPMRSVSSLTKGVQFIKKNQGIALSLTPLTLLSGLTVQLPALYLSAYFDYRYMGAYLVATKFLNMPISVISTPLGQYLQSIFQGITRRRINFVIIGHCFVVLIAFIAMALISMFDMSALFGGDWAVIKQVVIFLAAAKAAQAVNLPLANLLSLTAGRAYGLAVVIVFLPIRWVLMGVFGQSWEAYLTGVVVGSIIFYAFYSLLAYRISIRSVMN